MFRSFFSLPRMSVHRHAGVSPQRERRRLRYVSVSASRSPILVSCKLAQGIVDDRLRLFEHEAQVTRAPEAFGVDLVDVLGA
jgi:hypothetical protein